MATGCDALLFMPLLLITDAEVGVDFKIADSVVSIYVLLGAHDDEK